MAGYQSRVAHSTPYMYAMILVEGVCRIVEVWYFYSLDTHNETRIVQYRAQHTVPDSTMQLDAASSLKFVDSIVLSLVKTTG
jgi:hypothetical protein